jgi:hypothetical protein
VSCWTGQNGSVPDRSSPVCMYAVCRYDWSLDGPDVDPSLLFTVKEVRPTPEEADAEVVRLNGLNGENATYFVQVARVYPDTR